MTPLSEAGRRIERPTVLVVGSGRWQVPLIDRARELATRGVAANFLTSYVSFERPHNFHHSPQDLFTLGHDLTPWVCLRHDYPLWEFTLQHRREGRKP